MRPIVVAFTTGTEPTTTSRHRRVDLARVIVRRCRRGRSIRGGQRLPPAASLAVGADGHRIEERAVPTSVEELQAAARLRVWSRLDEAGAVVGGTSHGKIPNFVGAERAAERLAAVDAWRRARVIKSVPDKAQLPAHMAATAPCLSKSSPTAGRPPPMARGRPRLQRRPHRDPRRGDHMRASAATFRNRVAKSHRRQDHRDSFGKSVAGVHDGRGRLGGLSRPSARRGDRNSAGARSRRETGVVGEQNVEVASQHDRRRQMDCVQRAQRRLGNPAG
jgi:hypothetical protein